MKEIRIVTTLLVLMLSGCAVFQGNEVASNQAQGKFEGKPRRITYSIEGNVENKEEELLKSTMSKYGLQLEWGHARNDGVAHIDINLSFRRNGAAVVPAILTGLTLYIIPSWQTQNYELQANLTNGQTAGYDYRSKDHTTLVQWLPMIFAFPFAMPFTAEDKVIERMYSDMAYKVSRELNENRSGG